MTEQPKCFGINFGSDAAESDCDQCPLFVACRQKTFAAMRARAAKLAPDPTPLAVQVGGNHYKDMRIQPFEYIHANGIPFAEGCVIKYVSRWRNKSGIEDLRKARHFLDLLIAAEEARPT